MAGFRFDISKLIKLKRILGSAEGATVMKPLYERWGIRYLSFARQKFTINSAGGGDWPSLANSTIASRMRKSRRTRRGRRITIAARAFGIHNAERIDFVRENLRTTILVDTGVLKNGLNVGATGNLFAPHTFGIKVGYSGGSHPRSRASIAQIAAYHNAGTGRLPQRQIIYPPDEGVKASMFGSLRSHIASIGAAL